MAATEMTAAILCHVSPNPSPQRMSISGDPAQVAAIREKAAQGNVATLVAAAEDRGVGFARFELRKDAVYRDVGALVFEVQRRGLMLAMGTEVSSCPDGGMEDFGDSYAPIRIALIGDPAALDRSKADIAWTKPAPVRLDDGRSGWAFTVEGDDPAPWQALFARAARGGFEGLDVVRLRYGGPGGK